MVFLLTGLDCRSTPTTAATDARGLSRVVMSSVVDVAPPTPVNRTASKAWEMFRIFSYYAFAYPCRALVHSERVM